MALVNLSVLHISCMPQWKLLFLLMPFAERMMDEFCGDWTL